MGGFLKDYWKYSDRFRMFRWAIIIVPLCGMIYLAYRYGGIKLGMPTHLLVRKFLFEGMALTENQKIWMMCQGLVIVAWLIAAPHGFILYRRVSKKYVGLVAVIVIAIYIAERAISPRFDMGPVYTLLLPPILAQLALLGLKVADAIEHDYPYPDDMLPYPDYPNLKSDPKPNSEKPSSDK